MDIKELSNDLSVTSQVTHGDITQAAEKGIKTVICNRPDNEAEDQPTASELQALSESLGMKFYYLPVIPGQITDGDIKDFQQLLNQVEAPILAYCRTGTRSASLWALSQVNTYGKDSVLAAASAAGYDLSNLSARLDSLTASASPAPSTSHDVVIIGGGAAGQAVAASLYQREPDLDIAIIEPSDQHFYQPGWTMVGGGVFTQDATVKAMSEVMPNRSTWYQDSVISFSPDENAVLLENGGAVGYRTLVVAPGLSLNWDAIPGLTDTLGSNGVTSNYRFDLAPYTWELINQLKKGEAVFTQPPMPIKCAGAPQKAMYLACSQWQKNQNLKDINVSFFNAGAALFGVADYVPALMEYIKHYGINLQFQHTLTQVDGANKTACFSTTDTEGNVSTIEKSFDMLHVCPPQVPPAFISASPLSDDAGWLAVNMHSLQQDKYPNIFGIGDVLNTPNAKTAAAVRKQAPVVADNVMSVLSDTPLVSAYTGYGSCPLTVEHGRIVLAEFGYGGKLDPTLPQWLIKGTEPRRLSWELKSKLLPWVYWNLMLKGKEWLAKPARLGSQG